MVRVRLVLPVLVGTAALSACGGATPGARSSATPVPEVSPVLRLQAASETTSRAGSAHFKVTSDTRAASQDVTVLEDGTLDAARRLARISLRMRKAGGPQTSLEERLVGDALYIEMPKAPGTFYRLSVSQLVGTQLASSTDPMAGLQTLKAASADVVVVGSEPVRGEQTTHYRGTYDLKAALDKVQGAYRQVLDTALAGGDVSAVPYDAWIDRQGRLRKMTQQLTLSVRGKQVRSTSTAEVFDFGTPVDVPVPAPDKVKDGAPVLQALKGAGGS